MHVPRITWPWHLDHRRASVKANRLHMALQGIERNPLYTSLAASFFGWGYRCISHCCFPQSLPTIDQRYACQLEVHDV